MPDDQVVEQTDGLVTDTEADATDAFDEEESEETTLGLDEELSTPSEKQEEEEPEEESLEEEEEEEAEDEDVLRGKEILESQRKSEEEKKRLEEEAQAKTEPEEKKYTFDKYSDENLDILHGLIPPNLFPDTVKLPDGTELDYGDITGNFPALPSMIAGIANHVIRSMMETGYLVGGEQLKNEISGTNQARDKSWFIRTVTHPVYGVQNAAEIVNSDDYKKWFPEQPEEIQALRNSGNPHDMVRLIKRFLGKEVLDGLAEAAGKKDEQRRNAKGQFEAVHKTTAKSSGKPSRKVKDSPADEAEAFDSDDDENDF